MLLDAKIIGLKRLQRRRTGIVLTVFLISINIINFMILTRCLSGTETHNNKYPLANSNGGRRTEESQTSNGGARIPKIVHLTWKNTVIPNPTVKWVQKWKDTNPGYDVWFWTDEDAHSFIKQNYTQFYETFKKYNGGIFRADAMRYFILYHFGGFYADLDVEPLRSLEPIRLKHACVVAREPIEHAEIAWNYPVGQMLACNAFMACRPHHPFMRLIIDLLEISGTKEKNPVVSTGPVMLTKALKMYNNIDSLMSRDVTGNDAVFVAPPDYFIPRVDQDVIDRLLPHCGNPSLPKKWEKHCESFSRGDYHNGPTENSFTDHHWWHSWFHQNKKEKGKSIAQVIPYVTLARSIVQ